MMDQRYVRGIRSKVIRKIFVRLNVLVKVVKTIESLVCKIGHIVRLTVKSRIYRVRRFHFDARVKIYASSSSLDAI